MKIKYEFNQTFKRIRGEVSKAYGNQPQKISMNLNNVLSEYKKEAEKLKKQFQFYSRLETDMRNMMS